MRGEIRRGPWPTCGSCSRALACPTRHGHGDREQSPGTRRTVPQADTCTATRHDLVRATSPTPGPHRPPSSARSPPVRPRRPLIQPAMRTVYSPHYLPVDLLVMERCLLGTFHTYSEGINDFNDIKIIPR